MTTETGPVDPYDAVLADLRVKRDEIDRAIRMIESVRGLTSRVRSEPPLIPTPAKERPVVYAPGHPEAGPFAGLTIPEAAKKLLQRERKHLTNPELANQLKHGGLVMRSDDPANTIGSVLKRRQEEVGDLVRINPGRGGKWGLAEWGGVDPTDSSAL